MPIPNWIREAVQVVANHPPTLILSEFCYRLEWQKGGYQIKIYIWDNATSDVYIHNDHLHTTAPDVHTSLCEWETADSLE